MTISVEFPDGSLRDMPSELRADHATGAFLHVPLDCNAQWRFVRRGKGWQAQPRHGSLAVLTPQVDEWWRGIATMADGPPLPRAPIRSPRAA
jgi:hypothetical protein